MSFLERVKTAAFEKLLQKSEKSQNGFDQLIIKLKKHPELASGCFCDDATWDKLSYKQCCDAIQKAVKLQIHEIQFDPEFDLDKPFKMVYRRKEGSAAPIIFIANVADEVPPMGMRFDVKIMPEDIETIAYMMTRVWWLTMLSGKYSNATKAKEVIETKLHQLQDDVTQLLISLRRQLSPEVFSENPPLTDDYQQWLFETIRKATGGKTSIARCAVDEMHQYLMATVCRQNVAVNCTPLRTSMKAYLALIKKQPPSLVQNFIATFHSTPDFADACKELWQHYPSTQEIYIDPD